MPCRQNSTPLDARTHAAHLLLRLDVIKEFGEPKRPARAADDPAVEPDRHHLGLRRTFFPEHVQRVLEVLEETVALERLHSRKRAAPLLQRALAGRAAAARSMPSPEICFDTPLPPLTPPTHTYIQQHDRSARQSSGDRRSRTHAHHAPPRVGTHAHRPGQSACHCCRACRVSSAAACRTPDSNTAGRRRRCRRCQPLPAVTTHPGPRSPPPPLEYGSSRATPSSVWRWLISLALADAKLSSPRLSRQG